MTTELESRRQAIADALREVMAEPLTAVEPLPPVPVGSDADDEDGAAGISEVEDDSAEIVEDEVTTPAVPPLEPIGEMSPVAARALFGHH